VIRSFGSFQAAASEAALCRIFAGQYTMIDLGRQLGRHAGDFGHGHFGHGASRRSLRKGALPLTGAPGEDGPGGGRSGQGLKPSGARGRLGGAAGRTVACPHHQNNQPARVNTTLLLAVLVGGIVNVTRR
jgi:hypothetical protein